MDTPYNYLLFCRIFPKLSNWEQHRLLSLLASPSEVRHAIKIMRDDAKDARKVQGCFKRLISEILTP